MCVCLCVFVCVCVCVCTSKLVAVQELKIAVFPTVYS